MLIKVRCHYFSQNLRNSSDSASHVQSKKFDRTDVNIRTQKGLYVQTEAKKKLVARQKQISHPVQLKRKNSTRFRKPACNGDSRESVCVRHQYFDSCKLPYSLPLPSLPALYRKDFPKWRIFTAEKGSIKAKNSMVE